MDDNPSTSIFAPEPGQTVFQIGSFQEFLKFFKQKIRLHPESVQFELADDIDSQVFTTGDLQEFDKVRAKYKHNRTFYSDGKHICIKEMPSPAHSRAASFVQTKLMNAIVSQILLPNNAVPDDEKIVTTGDQHTKLPHFSGEPDGGLLWDGEELPFAVIEVGISDGGAKTRGRCRHWITRGGGSIKLALSVKITVGNGTPPPLQSIFVDSYRYSTQPINTLVTRLSTYGRVVHIQNIELVQGNTTVLIIPSDVISTSTGRPPLIQPLPQSFTVDLQALVVRIQNALS